MNIPQNYSDQFFQQMSYSARTSAKVLVPIVSDLVKPTSVVDIGCGQGTWLAEFKSHRTCREVLGIDGSWVNPEQLEISPNEFRTHDLTQPLALDRTFDLATCLEVGEHLDAQYAPALIQSLVNLAPIVLFSAAIPCQGGTNHVNERWPEYWRDLFLKHDYVLIDCLRHRLWNNSDVAFYYAQNCFLYVRVDLAQSNPLLKKALELTRPSQLALVHPTLFFQCAQWLIDPSRLAQIGLRDLLRATAIAAKIAIQRRLPLLKPRKKK